MAQDDNGSRSSEPLDLSGLLWPLTCPTCRTTQRATAEDAARGYAVCVKCGAVLDLAGSELGLGKRLVLGLLGRAMQTARRTVLDSLDAPAERPGDARIELANDPGQFFEAKIPPAGFGGGGAVIAFFTAIWCAFMVMWNTIGVIQGEWTMLLFGLLHDAVGLFLIGLTSWRLFGRETIRAEYGWFVHSRRLFGVARERKIEWQTVERFYFELGASRHQRPGPRLYAAVGQRRLRLAANASTDELRWLRTELARFYEPIWRK